MRHPALTVLLLAVGAAALAWGLAPRRLDRAFPEVPAVAAEAGPGRLVVDLVDGASEADRATVARLVGAELPWVHPLAVDEALVAGDVADVAAAVRALDGHPLVEAAEPAVTFSGLPTAAPLAAQDLPIGASYPNDPMFPKQWNLRAIGAERAWAGSPRGRGVIVAVLDTGVGAVEDLAGTNLLEGASFVPGEPTSRDEQGHGTHVAGTIAQTTHNGVGVAGIAPEATILPIKVLSRTGAGQSAWIAAGIDHAVDEGAQVLNLSLGSPVRARVIEIALEKARASGVLVIAAAGNSGREGVHFPGALPTTLGVAALGPDGRPAPYSTFGRGVDLAAPGGDTRVADGGILQDTVGPGGVGHQYAAYQGTSMATPHVAGAAAILLSTGLSADEVEARLLRGARGASWDPHVGHGALDLAAALRGVAPEGSPVRALLGAVVALLIGRLAGASIRWLAVAATVGALVAGGAFFLAWVPLASWGPALRVLSVGLLHWPAALGWPALVGFPGWASAALPVGIALFLGAFRPTRAVALGVAVGVGAHLLHGAVTAELPVWWLGTWSGPWLVANATVCALVGLALAGAEKLEREAR